MKANYDSLHPYAPVYLSGGRDTVQVDYTGMGACFNPHSHCEHAQGTVCGWYKASNRRAENYHALQPNFTFQLCVKLYGAAAEPTFYEQELIPETATLVTDLTFAKTIKMRVTAFLTDDSLLFQKAEVLENTNAIPFDLGWQITKPGSPMAGLTFRAPFAFETKAQDDRLYRFTYENGADHGQGFMVTDTAFDKLGTDTGWYTDVKTGFVSVRCISCTDESEPFNGKAVLEDRLAVAKDGFAKAYAAHCAVWKRYFDTNRIVLDDEELTDLYRISRYILRANQHPTGRIALGNVPHLWGGGIYDTYDEWQALVALLKSGNTAEAKKLVEAYVEQAKYGREALKKAGIKGAAFAGWDDCYGGFMPNGSYLTYITEYKPLMSMYVVLAVARTYEYDHSVWTPAVKDLVRDVVDFLMDFIIKKHADGSYGLKEVSAGSESGFLVKVDSFNQLVAARTMDFAGKMLCVPEYAAIGRSLREGLNVNMTEEGLLMPFDGAAYTACEHLLLHMVALPEKLGVYGIDRVLERAGTPFGISGDQTTEEYRHWPWYDAMAVSAYAREGYPQKADPYFAHMKAYHSAVGALPEKIRLDGGVVGYWYTTTHAFLAIAVNDALALLDGDTVMVGYGFETAVKSAGATGIRLNHQLTADVTVEHSRVTGLVLHNDDKTDVTLTVDVHHGKTETVTLTPGAHRIL